MVCGRVRADGPGVRKEQFAAAIPLCRGVEVREHGRGQENLLVGACVIPKGERRLHGHHVHHGNVAEGELEDEENLEILLTFCQHFGIFNHKSCL